MSDQEDVLIIPDDGSGEKDLELERLEKLNSEALDEFEKQEDLNKETIRNKPSKKEALNKLETLLSQATQYTSFLEEQLIRVHGQEYDDGKIGSREKKQKLVGDEQQPPEHLLSQPKCMTGGTLKEYQLTGFRWLTGLWENGLNGILADEMGLGKTIQTLALMAHLHELKVYGWRLIVVPLSTMTNWVSEAKHWVPTLPVLMYHGTPEERAALRKTMASKKKKEAEIPLVITTYEIACRDRKDLTQFNWSFLVVDEGHRLKNRHCRLIKELNALVGTKPAIDGGCTKILLTGTPLQNDLTELWSLLNFLLPQVFSSLAFFQSVFELEGGDGTPADETKIVMLQQEQNIVTKLHRILRPFMMRRLKNQVEQNLPPKLEIVLYCGMTKNQRDLYESVKRGELAQLIKASRNANESFDTRTYMNLVMQLRKASNHPYLHFDPTADMKETDESLVQASGKMVVLDQMLKELKKRNHKVLIFSQFTSMIDIIDDYLRFLRPQYRYCRLDGSTHFTDRRDLMKEFNEKDDSFIFLLSTRAGGMGINLVASDTVIIFDSDWNPQVDSQAQDRAHRIGQKKPVAVFRLVSTESVELKILMRANAKRKLERVVCRSRQNDMTTDELKDLLADDFSGHLLHVGEIDNATLKECFMDRKKLFSGNIPKKGKGYEIVEHQAASIVGGVND
jgi:ATP-dependent DNA helicase